MKETSLVPVTWHKIRIQRNMLNRTARHFRIFYKDVVNQMLAGMYPKIGYHCTIVQPQDNESMNVNCT